MTQQILIIGKNGKTGARVQRRLQALGIPTRGVSRSTETAFDWNHPETWGRALDGCHAAYITFQPDLAVPGAEQCIADFVALAAAKGLEHLVLLSGRGEDGAVRAENVLRNSGLDWNIVRSSWFAQNFSEDFMLQGILTGELALPAGDIPEPFIDVDDIADVAVAALTRPGLRNRMFEISGPRALTFAECMAEISAGLGTTINYRQIPLQAFIATLAQQGAPQDLQWLMGELFSVVLDGRNSQPVDGVAEALGRPARDFRDYVAKTVESGVWRQSLSR